MKTAEKSLLNLLIQAYEKKQLEKYDRQNFIRDRKQFERKELTFRELMESIRQPSGELKKAMEAYYEGSAYRRVFKGK